MTFCLKYSLFIFILVISFSCNSTNQPNGSSNSPSILLPSISGAAGEVLIVMDNENWKGNAGNILRETLEQQYPALPQPEPLFDVVHITQGAFDNLFQHHRSIILVNLSPEITKSKVGYFENVWAKPQIMIKIEAQDSYDLDSLLAIEKGNILNNIQSYDRKRMINLFNDSKDQAIKSEVSKFNISLAIPRGYSTDISNDEFASFSIETSKTSQVIFVYQYPYHGSKDFLTENIILRRDEFLKKYTLGTRTGSYLTTAKLFPPLAYDIKKNGLDIVEIRGLWELVNGYMGGPFILHAALDQKRNMIVVVEGYVYNPNNKKRNTMRHLESIIYSMQFLQ
jgi:Domain of unknown function (DUF4837)